MDCGIVVGNLFNPAERAQLSLEQVEIHDDVNAIHYTAKCDDPLFRKYKSYRFTLSSYADNPGLDSCGINGTLPPPDPNNPFPCTGDIDIRFSTMLVTTQTSTHRKNWIDMLTDEVSATHYAGSLDSY